VINNDVAIVQNKVLTDFIVYYSDQMKGVIVDFAICILNGDSTRATEFGKKLRSIHLYLKWLVSQLTPINGQENKFIDQAKLFVDELAIYIP